jgi:hypothetical protein
MVLSVIQVEPMINYAMASGTERSDLMQTFGRTLMGLGYPLQIVGQARAVDQHPDWPQPPRLERRWLAVIDDPDGWRTRTLKGALESVGLRCSDYAGDHPGDSLAGRPDATHVRETSGVLASTLVLRRWPREVAPGWLGQALSSNLPVDVAIHLQPQDSAWVARKLKLQQSRFGGSDDAADMLSTRDARRVREDMIAHRDRPVRVAIAFTVRAKEPVQLAQYVETLRHEIGLTLGDVRLAKYEQDLGLRVTLPLAECELRGAWHTLDCTSVASTWPFQPATVNHGKGAPLGTTHDGSMLVTLDPFDPSLESFGGLILAKVGMGKSYFLKLIARRLPGVEVLIVEQRTPAEYRGIRGAVTVNLADLPYAERASRLREFVSQLWETAKSDPRPRLLILDELWSLLRDPGLASLVEEIARIGRHHYLSLWIATQQVRELLESGRAVLDNAAIRVYLKQHDRDLADLCDAVGLPGPARRFLRSAARGQALLDVGGLLVPVDIQASEAEHRLITTDPREVRHGMGNMADHRGDAARIPADPLDRQGVDWVVDRRAGSLALE